MSSTKNDQDSITAFSSILSSRSEFSPILSITTPDLISKLRPFPHILEQVFRNLPGTYLRVIPCICKKWSDIITRLTPLANKRRERNLRKLRKTKRQVGRENWPIDVECSMFKNKRRKLSRQITDTMSSMENKLPRTTNSYTCRSILGIRNVNSLDQTTTLSTVNQSKPPRKMKRRLQVVDENADLINPVKRTQWKLAMAASKTW